MAVLGVVAIIGLVIAVRHFESQLPSVPDLKRQYHPAQVTRVLARDGSVLAELFTQRRTVVPIGSDGVMPQRGCPPSFASVAGSSSGVITA